MDSDTKDEKEIPLLKTDVDRIVARLEELEDEEKAVPAKRKRVK